MDTTPRQDWQLQAQPGRDGAPLRLRLLYRGAPVDLAAAFDALAEDADCRTAFNAGLAVAPFAAFRWECPPLQQTLTPSTAFECMVIDAPELQRPADPSAFGDYFDDFDEALVTTFWNLGRDAQLIVPLPVGDDAAYPHLASFVRAAPKAQRDAFWRRVGREVQCARHGGPLWVSTAGDGVPWLHVRLDQRPKYYRTSRYRDR
ncbi:DUF6940 family protein [Algiphilus sp.]|uniref:DUF6940 family protein n=1 Tax=Algiphilus sp. TaxID=1872431 RepID=UPI003B522469